MEKANFVSIIIPCYNYAHFLPQTLNCLIEQSYPNWECVIVDDGSKDNTRDVAYTYINLDNRFRYFYQSNKGLSAARNFGIVNCKGNYVQFLDSDDLIHKRKIELQVATLDKNTFIDIIYGNVRYFESNKPDKLYNNFSLNDNQWMPCLSGKGTEILREVLEMNIMVVSSPLIRISVIKEVGLFDTSLNAYEDWHYWIKCALKNYYFLYDNRAEALTYIRVHTSSMSKDNERMMNAMINLCHNLKPALEKYPQLSKYNETRLSDYYRLKAQSIFKKIHEGKFFSGFLQLITLAFKSGDYKFLIMNGLFWTKERFITSKNK